MKRRSEAFRKAAQATKKHNVHTGAASSAASSTSSSATSSTTSSSHGTNKVFWNRSRSRFNASTTGGQRFTPKAAARTPAAASAPALADATPEDADVDESTLNAKQRLVLQYCDEGRSFLVTGAAGTGKSFTLRQAIRRLRQRHGAEMIYVTASTGTAAFNIGGITVHSFAGIGMGTGTIRQLVDKVEASPACANWQTARCLVIDEVSMLDGKLFDTLEEVARGVRGNSAPFGGLQVVVFGDFYQLPPVSLQANGYAFDAASWSRVIVGAVELDEVIRQSDSTFVRMLHEIRIGRPSPSTIEALRERTVARLDAVVDANAGTTASSATADTAAATTDIAVRSAEERSKYIVLYPHCVDVEADNRRQLNELAAPSVYYYADDYVARGQDAHLQRCNAPDMLELKIGARVMLNKNTDTKSGLVNGAQGVVVDFQTVAVDKSTVIRSSGTGVSVRPEDVLSGGAQTGATSDGAADMPDDTVTMRVPVVRFHHGLEVPVRPVRFQYMAGKRVLARRTQVPLTLAWSITVHRVQGQTLTHMEADASKVFGPGMFYTIASRLTSIDGLRLKSFDPRRIVADARVDAFYQRLHQMAVPPNDD